MAYEIIGTHMQASKLIQHLEYLIDIHGDGEVMVSYNEEMEFHYSEDSG